MPSTDHIDIDPVGNHLSHLVVVLGFPFLATVSIADLYLLQANAIALYPAIASTRFDQDFYRFISQVSCGSLHLLIYEPLDVVSISFLAYRYSRSQRATAVDPCQMKNLGEWAKWIIGINDQAIVEIPIIDSAFPGI